MRSATTTRTLLALACLAALATPAHAEIGETVGRDEFVSAYGPNWGNDFAKVSLSINSTAGYQHDANTASAVRAVSWSAPGARLFRKGVTLWDVTADSLAIRHRTDLAAMGTGATGKIIIDGDSFFECFLLGPAPRALCQRTINFNRVFAENRYTYYIAGVIPVTLGGSIAGSVNVTVNGDAQMTPFSTNVAQGADDITFGSFAVNAAVYGTSWFTVLAPPAIGAELRANVDFIRLAVGPRADAKRRTCRTGAADCSQDRRTNYSFSTLAESTTFHTLGGKIEVEGCIIGFCAEDSLLDWRGQDLGRLRMYSTNRNERFSSRY